MAIVVGVSVYFFIEAVYPGIDRSAPIDPLKWAPLPALIWLFLRDRQLARAYDTKYGDYLRISPGIPMQQSIDYGTSHGKQ
jgi:hypothetical protein